MIVNAPPMLPAQHQQPLGGQTQPSSARDYLTSMMSGAQQPQAQGMGGMSGVPLETLMKLAGPDGQGAGMPNMSWTNTGGGTLGGYVNGLFGTNGMGGVAQPNYLATMNSGLSSVGGAVN